MSGRASRTRERVLKAGLTLFNTEGETAVSMVDIASELGISPGNLYYHYKGKEPLILELFDRFEVEMLQVLQAPEERRLAIEDSWVFLYIIFEEIFDFRFFYLNLASILERVPAIKPRFTRLVRAAERTMTHLISNLEAEGLVVLSAEQKRLTAERSAREFTFWPQWVELMEDPDDLARAIHEGVYRVFSAVAPYFDEDAGEFEALLREFKKRMVGE